MCVLYVSFGYKVRPVPFGCIAMGSAVLFILTLKGPGIFTVFHVGADLKLQIGMLLLNQ